MAQDSWCYNCTVGGDARAIDQTDWNFVRGLLSHADRTLDGIIYTKNTSYSSLAAPSNPGGNTVRIANGAALVNGYVWWSDANVDFDVSGGNANATDLIVLRSTPATGLVRLALVRGPAAGTATVTQSAATWEIAIAEVLLDGAGNFSALTDVRKLCMAKGAVIPLETQTGTGASGTISFTNIPPFFNHLKVEATARSDALGLTDFVLTRLNGDTGTNYLYSRITGINSTVSHTGAAGQTSVTVATVTGSTGLATVVDGFSVIYYDYTNTTPHKTFKAEWVSAGSGALGASGLNNGSTGGWWQNTAAINQVDIFLASANFTTASKFTLYGILQ